jgi:putative hydrolase of the HAD superfamily
MTFIDAVVFDFGGVFTPSPFDAVRILGEGLGLDEDQAMLYVFGPYDRDTDHPWHQAERGELDLASARDQIQVLARTDGYDVDLYELFGLLGGTAVRPEMVDRTRALKQAGYRTAMITNNVLEFRQFWRPMVPLDELFDVVIDSSEVGMRKPDPRIFQLALDQLGGIEPSRAVFLDDYLGNVMAAEAMGIRGVLVEAAYAEAIDRLDSILDGIAPSVTRR